MRILLTQATLYYPSFGGANKSNRMLLEALTRKGHECSVVARELLGNYTRSEFQNLLTNEGIRARSETPGVDVYSHNGVEVSTVWESPSLRPLWRQIRKFNPEWVLVSSDDPSQLLLSGALKECASRVVYLALTTLALPFGPDSGFVDDNKTDLLRRAAGIITISNYLQDYIKQWGGLESTVLPIQLYGSGPFPDYSQHNEGFVTIVNPCAYKGISIFLELARGLPDVNFAAVPTWGTDRADLRALESCGNVTILQPVEDIDQIFARTRILLAPSLWAEAFGRISVEAMLRGIPVLASNAGGLPEAKLGIDYVLPVRPITNYGSSVGAHVLPTADVPEQDIEPWLHALQCLLEDEAHYRELAKASRDAALEYLKGITIEPFEAYLRKRTEQRC